MYGIDGNPFVVLIREPEKKSVCNEILDLDIVPEYQMCGLLELGGGDVVGLAGLVVQGSGIEGHSDFPLAGKHAVTHNVVPGGLAPGNHIAPVGGPEIMPFDIACSLHRRLHEVRIAQGKVVDKPYTESKQEGQKKNSPVPPADVHQLQYLMKEVSHYSMAILLLNGVREILYN